MQLNGDILDDIPSLSGSLTDIPSLSGSLTLPTAVEYETYVGPYNIVPKAYQDQLFNTLDKLMTDDLLVQKIPHAEAHNDSVGITMTIG